MRAYRHRSAWIGRFWTRQHRGQCEVTVEPTYSTFNSVEPACEQADELLAGMQSFKRLTKKVLARYSGFDEHDAKLYVHFMLDRGRQSWAERDNLLGPFWLPADVVGFAQWYGYRNAEPSWFPGPIPEGR